MKPTIQTRIEVRPIDQIKMIVDNEWHFKCAIVASASLAAFFFVMSVGGVIIISTK